jgi:hypothetical protein
MSWEEYVNSTGGKASTLYLQQTGLFLKLHKLYPKNENKKNEKIKTALFMSGFLG